ncbi:hypothetical protein [Methylomonas albis]|uniref:PEP-CTERM protein-sorting domain-containing protein n=1 Tax=Methylomonas albis TaxID=1854563 RepID=A0ABR9D0V7_9GAMM|nr:hypothetical protein [Methylomonas albis]MBD9356750.1 hypothetical protein [Methylomonas albis]CAD6879899.1 hypothetical protein [Methylomonas albis]
MNSIVRYLALTTAILASVGSSTPATAALVQYTYTGNTFTDIYPPGFGDIGLNISFIVEESLLPKNGRAVLDVDDYSSGRVPFTFSFGLGQYYKIDTAEFYANPNNAGVDPHFQTYFDRSARIEFDTDAEGHFSGNWSAVLNKHEYGRPGLLGGVSISSSAYSFSSVDSAEFYGVSGSVTGNPGTWVRQLAPVPLPVSGFLFSFAIAGLGLRKCFNRQ